MLMATRLRRRPNAESEEGARGGVARTVARVQTRQPTIGWIDDSVSVGRTRGRTCRLPPDQPRYGGETEAKLSLLTGALVVDRVGVAGQFDGSIGRVGLGLQVDARAVGNCAALSLLRVPTLEQQRLPWPERSAPGASRRRARCRGCCGCGWPRSALAARLMHRQGPAAAAAAVVRAGTSSGCTTAGGAATGTTSPASSTSGGQC